MQYLHTPYATATGNVGEQGRWYTPTQEEHTFIDPIWFSPHAEDVTVLGLLRHLGPNSRRDHRALGGSRGSASGSTSRARARPTSA